MVGFVKDTVSRTVTGCGELWSNHGHCNEIRNKMKAHRLRIKEAWTEKGLYSPNSQYTPKQLNQQLEAITGGISYEEYAFLQKGKEDNVQLCVYVDGKCVVDLYGTAIGDTDYNADTIQVSSLIEIF